MVRILTAALFAALLAACAGTPDSSSGAQSDTGMANPVAPVPVQGNPPPTR